jgi:hypothetical protein
MSLDWNVKAIIEREGDEYVWPKGVDGEQRLRGSLECLIWATIFVGINRITEENWKEFALRLRAWEIGVGCISASNEPLEAETVRRAIGLSTNASPETPAAFKKKLAEAVMSEAKRKLDREIGADERRRATP